MRSDINKNEFRLANNLLVLRGQRSDVVVGNGDDFRFLHIENGKAFLNSLDKAKKQGVLEIDQKLLRLLRLHKIVVAKDVDIKRPPIGARTCCGTIGEQTLVLPLAGSVHKEVYERAVHYGLEIAEDNSTLTVQFHGQDRVSNWPVIRETAELVSRKGAELRPDVRLKYHFDSRLQRLPRGMLKWLEQNDVAFTVFLPMPNGAEDAGTQSNRVRVEENIKKLSQVGIRVCMVTPAVQNNVQELPKIAEHHTELNIQGGFEFPALPDPRHPWLYGVIDDLPDSEMYLQALIDVYRGKYLEEDLFVPVNELRHRIVHGGYAAGCSCLYDHVTAVDIDGDVFPCMAALRFGRMRIGNIRGEPEGKLQDAHQELCQIKESSWTKCNVCSWRGLCGMHCPLVNHGSRDKATAYSEEAIERYVCRPRLGLLREIIWDMVKDLGQRVVGSPAPLSQPIPGTVLIMLSSNSCSACYQFGGDEKVPVVRMSPKTLTDILLKTAGEGDKPTLVPLFLAHNDEPLDPTIASILEGLSDYIITPLLSSDQQMSLRIPFSPDQTVVADSVRELVEHKKSIRARAVILHVLRTEITSLAEQLLSIQHHLQKVTLRLKSIVLLEEEDIHAYRSQLERLARVNSAEDTSSEDPGLDITNLNIHASELGCHLRCPAGLDFIVVGPDGLVYPCSAFYRAGAMHAIGSVDDVGSARFTLDWDLHRCQICGSSACLGCPFLESEQISGRENLCKVHEVERLIAARAKY